MPYVNQRWLGGTLTNFATIQKRIEHLVRARESQQDGEFERCRRRKRSSLDEELDRLNRYFGGIKEMSGCPARSSSSTRQGAHRRHRGATLEIPIVAMGDTNSNPDEIDYLIPATTTRSAR